MQDSHKLGASFEVELHIVFGRKDVHRRVAGCRIKPEGAAVSAIDREGIGRISVAVRVVGEIFKIAVDKASLDAEADIVREPVGDGAAALQRAAIITVPARLADKGVGIEPAPGVGGVREESSDERRVGEGCVGTGGSRWSAYHYNKILRKGRY